MSKYGDKNYNTVWLQRNASGLISHIIDGGAGGNASTGVVAITLHYNSATYLISAKDYPQSSNSLDNPARSVNYVYDNLGRMTAVTDTRGQTTRYEYDYRARLSKTIDPLGRATSMVYEDESNSVKQMTAADGGVSDYAFNYDDAKKLFYSKAQGPVTASGRRVEDYTHDRAGDLLKYEVNGRAETTVTRDPVARTETRTNARGFATVYTKNEFEQIVQVQHPDGAKQSTQFEARLLNPVLMTDEAGIKAQYDYDTKGNLSKKTEALGTPDERTTEYVVDAAGRPTRVTRKGRTEANTIVTPDAVWQVAYDSAGQISQTTDPENNVRSYVYNRLGQLVKYVDPRGNATIYEVDANGNLLKVTNASRVVNNY